MLLKDNIQRFREGVLNNYQAEVVCQFEINAGGVN